MSDTINKFWNLFKANDKQIYEDFENNNIENIEELLEQARQIEPNVLVEIFLSEEGKNQLIVSADGIRENIKSVEKVVEAAPELKHWEVVAFRQRLTETELNDFELQIDDYKWTVNDFWFEPITEEGNLDIIVYHDDYSEENSEGFVMAGFLLLDNVIGEYDVMTKLRYVDFAKRDDQIKDSTLPLIKLSDYVDDFFKDKK